MGARVDDGRRAWSRSSRAMAFLAGAMFAVVPPTLRAQPPVEAFFSVPEFSQPALSPDGSQMAALVASGTGRSHLAVFDTSDVSKGRVVASFHDADIAGFEWISDKRLVFRATDLTSGGGDQLAPGLFAVDSDGTQFRPLVDRNWRGVITAARTVADRTLPWYTSLASVSHMRDSDDVFVVQYLVDRRRFRPGIEAPETVLLKLNTRTGATSNLSLGAPTGSGTWVVDPNGEARMRVVPDKGRIAVHWRDPADDRWRVVSEFSVLGGEGFIPLRILRDGNLVVRSNAGRDTSALYLFEPSVARLSADPLVAVAGFDFDGTPIWDSNDRLLGVHVNGDGAGTVWLDSRMKEAQQLIDRAMPSTVNRITVPLRPRSPYLLVTSFSDGQPPRYALYDVNSRNLTRMASSRPAIDPAAMGRTDFVRFKARDGLDVPLYLTMPPPTFGKTSLPTVVLLHGGPWIRGTRWGWDAQTQFLASRGYLVLSPEFRGSTGYGFKHFQAGWRQWGRAMQDDVADAARWAVAQGLADPKRICLAGGSYGGYATLMGLASDPAAFRCGIAWVAMTDIDLLFSASWTDVTDSSRRYGLSTLVGDPVADAAVLRENSPLHNAARIIQPLMLAYGRTDLRVPLEHGQRFREAVGKTNARVEWIVYDDEGHNWTKAETHHDFWRRAEKFLAAHIGAAR